jgi:hypothetical protein
MISVAPLHFRRRARTGTPRSCARPQTPDLDVPRVVRNFSYSVGLPNAACASPRVIDGRNGAARCARRASGRRRRPPPDDSDRIAGGRTIPSDRREVLLRNPARKDASFLSRPFCSPYRPSDGSCRRAADEHELTADFCEVGVFDMNHGRDGSPARQSPGGDDRRHVGSLRGRRRTDADGLIGEADVFRPVRFQ